MSVTSVSSQNTINSMPNPTTPIDPRVNRTAMIPNNVVNNWINQAYCPSVASRINPQGF